MTTHRQVSIWNSKYKVFVEVDEGIAPLIQALWSKGIDTHLSCQENQPGTIWISFLYPYHADKFLTIVLQSATPTTERYWRIRGHEEPEWEYDISLGDWSEIVTEDDVIFSEPPEAWLSISVRFPISDYQWVLDSILQSSDAEDQESLVLAGATESCEGCD